MAEAIQWANRPQPTKVTIAAGNRRVVERIPQTGSFGDLHENRPARPRWRKVVDSYGNEVRVVLTTAAADLDTETNYGRYQRQKWRVYGWYEVGHCPCAMFLTGDLKAEHFSSAEVLADAKARTACSPGTYGPEAPCPHALKEMEARKKQNAEELAERLKNFQSESDRLIAANAKNTEHIVTGVAASMAGAVKEAMAAAVAQAAPPKEKK